MSGNLAEQRAVLGQRIDAALARLGEIGGEGPAFRLVLHPDDEALDALVAAESGWARGLLYATVAEYLEQLVTNWSALPASIGRAIHGSTPSREVRVSIDSVAGGALTAQVGFVEGRLDLVFRASSLKTNHAGWSDVGLDVHDALARSGSASAAGEVADEHPSAEPGPGASGSAGELAPGDHAAAIDAHLRALGDFVGDGLAWRYEWAANPASMDDEVARHASQLRGRLFETLDAMLGHLVGNLRRATKPEDLLTASPSRTLIFEFIDLDDCPRQYLGFFQAAIKGGRLHFVGPPTDFNTWGAHVGIGRDLEKALQASRGETGPTEREQRLSEALAAIADSSSRGGKGGGEASAGKACRMCKGTGRGTCNACHGKGGSCNVCKGSGRSKARCPSCKGEGAK